MTNPTTLDAFRHRTAKALHPNDAEAQYKAYREMYVEDVQPPKDPLQEAWEATCAAHRNKIINGVEVLSALRAELEARGVALVQLAPLFGILQMLEQIDHTTSTDFAEVRQRILNLRALLAGGKLEGE